MDFDGQTSPFRLISTFVSGIEIFENSLNTFLLPLNQENEKLFPTMERKYKATRLRDRLEFLHSFTECDGQFWLNSIEAMKI